MEILTTAIVHGQTLNLEDSFDIGNGVSVKIKELFSIDGCVYMATATENHPMMSHRLNEEGTETFTLNRYINPAELWIKKNIHLFNK